MATKYISPTGNDTTGDGTYALPYLTVAKAVAVTTTGDTIYFKNGTYTWSSNLAWNYDRIFQGETNGSAILDGASGSIECEIGTSNPICTVNDLVFKNATHSGRKGIFKMTAISPGMTTFNRCTFNDLTIDCWSTGELGGMFTYPDVSGAYIYYKFNNCLFNDCRKVSGMTGVLGGFNVGSSTGTYEFNNCVMYFETTGSVNFNSIIGTTSGRPVYCNVIFRNVIVANFAGYTLPLISVPANVTLTTANCCLYNITSYGTPTNTIYVDPLFIDRINNNFNLRSTSPCINTGTLL